VGVPAAKICDESLATTCTVQILRCARDGALIVHDLWAAKCDCFSCLASVLGRVIDDDDENDNNNTRLTSGSAMCQCGQQR
jgi:hypothetical protein